MAYRPRHRKQSRFSKLIARIRGQSPELPPEPVLYRPRAYVVERHVPRYGRQALHYGDPAGPTRHDSYPESPDSWWETG